MISLVNWSTQYVLEQVICIHMEMTLLSFFSLEVINILEVIDTIFWTLSLSSFDTSSTGLYKISYRQNNDRVSNMSYLYFGVAISIACLPMGSVLCGPITDHAPVRSIGSFCHELSILQGSHMYCPPTTYNPLRMALVVPFVHMLMGIVFAFPFSIHFPSSIFSDKYSVKSLLQQE